MPALSVSVSVGATLNTPPGASVTVFDVPLSWMAVHIIAFFMAAGVTPFVVMVPADASAFVANVCVALTAPFAIARATPLDAVVVTFTVPSWEAVAEETVALIEPFVLTREAPLVTVASVFTVPNAFAVAEDAAYMGAAVHVDRHFAIQNLVARTLGETYKTCGMFLGAGDAARHSQVLDGRPADIAERSNTLIVVIRDVDVQRLAVTVESTLERVDQHSTIAFFGYCANHYRDSI